MTDERKPFSESTFCEHDYEEFIDPNSGGFVRCLKCGKEVDCEEDEAF